MMSRSPARHRPLWWRRVVSWVGIVPFTLFVVIFLGGPVVVNLWQSVHDNQGRWTMASLQQLFVSPYSDSYIQTFELSIVTAILGAAIGLVLAWALRAVTRPRWLVRGVTSFCGAASQLGGIPLAFAFVALLGTQGILTKAIQQTLGVNLSNTLNLSSFWGITVVYLYFQVPLMAILIMPSLAGLRHEWRESATALGVGPARYLLDIALPLLWPSIQGALLILFANSFAAYATAYALTGGQSNLIAVLVGIFLSGNVFLDEGLGAALITGMIVVVALAFGARAILAKRSARWLG